MTIGPPPSVADRLKKARARAGLSWNQLAARSGVHRATIARIEAGTVEPDRLTIWLLAEATGETAAWLAGFDQGQSPAIAPAE